MTRCGTWHEWVGRRRGAVDTKAWWLAFMSGHATPVYLHI